MTNTKQALLDWQASLCRKVDHGGLLTRNPIAHKWKAPFRSLLVREMISWRTHDLLTQAHFLHEADHELGSRILLRSAFETLGVLIYVNQLTRKVISGEEAFNDFSEKTARLLLGSKDQSTKHEAINIISILEKCEKRFPGLMKYYATLSESAHPNHEGVCSGYSDVSDDVTTFLNKWSSIHGPNQLAAIQMCIDLFIHEYNQEWPEAFEKLEEWLVANDESLEVKNYE